MEELVAVNEMSNQLAHHHGEFFKTKMVKWLEYDKALYQKLCIDTLQKFADKFQEIVLKDIADGIRED